MNQKHISWIKGVLLAVFVLTAGVCYSCSGGENGGFLALEAAKLSGAEAADGAGALTGDRLSGADGVLSDDGASAQDGAGKSSDGASGQNGSGTLSGGASGADGVGSEAGGAGASGDASASGAGVSAAGMEEAKICYVHVCGQVLYPGVYRLKEGQRIYEAIELAGGFTEDASRTWLNLAEPVADGMKVEVPDQTQAQQWQQETAAGGAVSAAQGKVNINTAGREELMTLKGIGEARAEDIIRFREKQGYFQTIEDIMKVPGIKDAAFEKIKDEITV